MSARQITVEDVLYGLALALALSLRFLHLGALSLSDLEADWALQSLSLATGLKPTLGPNPAYLHLTAILFALLKASDFWARFWPALAGAGLVLAPWFVRKQIGRGAALVLAFGLALDPGLNAISRMAGGPILAVACLGLTLVLWLDGRRRAAGVFGGLALLGGATIWAGLLGLVMTWGLGKLLTRRKKGAENGEKEPGEEIPRATGLRFEELKEPLYWLLGTLFVVGSLLVFSLQGLAALAGSLLEYLKGWVTLSGVPLGRTLLALPAYELLPLGFGLAGLVRGIIKKDLLSIRLGTWAAAALLLVVLYPARQVADLSWMLLPMWVLAAIEIGRHFDLGGHVRWVMGGLGLFVFVLAILFWLQLAQINTLDQTQPSTRVQWLFLAAILLVMMITLILVGAGWTPDEARLGGVWGLLIPLLFFTVAMTTGAIQVREPRTLELWYPEPRLGRADLVLKVANEISWVNTGFDGQLPLEIVNVDSPALRWLFRDWEVKVTNVMAPGATPEMVITPITMDLSLTSEYRGEALTWREQGNWYEATFANWLNWFIYRQMPVQREDVILWVRADLFLDSQGLPTTP